MDPPKQLPSEEQCPDLLQDPVDEQSSVYTSQEESFSLPSPPSSLLTSFSGLGLLSENSHSSLAQQNPPQQPQQQQHPWSTTPLRALRDAFRTGRGDEFLSLPEVEEEEGNEDGRYSTPTLSSTPATLSTPTTSILASPCSCIQTPSHRNGSLEGSSSPNVNPLMAVERGLCVDRSVPETPRPRGSATIIVPGRAQDTEDTLHSRTRSRTRLTLTHTHALVQDTMPLSSSSNTSHPPSHQPSPPSLPSPPHPSSSSLGSHNPHKSHVHTQDLEDSQDCAICLDSILPKHHAKATLACRHEFHLSCISMAFSMGKEMICPLCRYLHKDQPFMGPEVDRVKSTGGIPSPTSTLAATPPSTTLPNFAPRRNTIGSSSSIHLQQHLSNLVQHQRRNYHPQTTHGPSPASSSSSSASPSSLSSLSSSGSLTSHSVLAMVPFYRDATGTSEHLNDSDSAGRTTAHTSGASFVGRRSSAGHPLSATLKTSTWLVVYAMPFSVAMALLAYLLSQVETLRSKVSCLIVAVVCFMVGWALMVAVLFPQEQVEERDLGEAVLAAASQFNLGGGATHPAALSFEASLAEAEVASVSVSPVPSYPIQTNFNTSTHLDNAFQSRADAWRRRSTPISPFSFVDRFYERAVTLQMPATSTPTTPPPSRASMSSESSLPTSRLWSRWTSYRYAQDLQTRMVDLAEVLGNFSDTLGEWR